MGNFFNKFAGVEEETGEEVTDAPTHIIAHTDERNEKEVEPKDWLDEKYEGQLSVDVYSTKDEVVVKSTIAGVMPEDIAISINNDMLTIRGERTQEKEEDAGDYYYQECYWGGFSRSIILPVEVDTEHISAQLKNGVLTIRMPKVHKSKSVSIKVNSE